MTGRRLIGTLITLLCTLWFISSLQTASFADEFRVRPIRIIVAITPGASLSVVALVSVAPERRA